MGYKTVKLKDGRTVALGWVKENDLPELVELRDKPYPHERIQIIVYV